VSARAYDNNGDSSLSDPVIIIVKPTLYCGDGTCSSDETCNSCSTDCGKCDSSNIKAAGTAISDLLTGEKTESGITVKSTDEKQEESDVAFVVSEEVKQNVKERSWLRDFDPSWIWGPILVLVVAILLFYAVRLGMTTGFKINPGIPRENLVQARDYIHKMLVFGYDEEHMKEKMKTNGWNDEQLEYVFSLYDVKNMIKEKKNN